MSRIVIVTGPPGAGKTSVARRVSQLVATPRAMHMHTDDIYAYVQKGFVPPWMPEAQAQNITLQSALAASAGICARDGYEVFLDGIVGVWFLDPWKAAAREHGIELHYVVLLPSEAETVARATARTYPGAMNDAGVSRQMWQAFHTYPAPSAHVLDTSYHSVPDTVAVVFEGLAVGRFRLAPD